MLIMIPLSSWDAIPVYSLCYSFHTGRCYYAISRSYTRAKCKWYHEQLSFFIPFNVHDGNALCRSDTYDGGCYWRGWSQGRTE